MAVGGVELVHLEEAVFWAYSPHRISWRQGWRPSYESESTFISSIWMHRVLKGVLPIILAFIKVNSFAWFPSRAIDQAAACHTCLPSTSLPDWKHGKIAFQHFQKGTLQIFLWVCTWLSFCPASGIHTGLCNNINPTPSWYWHTSKIW